MFFKRERTNADDQILIKSSAYDALIEYDVHTLPVPMPQTDTVIVFPMQCLKEPPIYCNIFQYKGVLMRVGNDNDKRYIIMFNRNYPETIQKWTVFQLLYYVKNGFADKHPKEYIENDCLPEASTFASHFSCPDIVLDSCKIKKSEDIIKYCKVPFNIAHQKSKYIKNGYKKFPFLSLEKMIKENFRTFIETF